MKKGISILTLVITIIVLIIITTITVVAGTNIINNTIKKSFASEMYSVKNLVEEYEFLHDEYPIKSEVIEFNISSLSTSDINQFSDENIVNNKVVLYEIDLSKAGVNSVNYGSGTSTYDIYAYSIDTNKIYYLAGKKIDGITYYTLTDELYDELGISEIN